MTCLGVLDRGERGDDDGTSLKEERVIEMSTTNYSAPFAMLALFALFAIELLTVFFMFHTRYPVFIFSFKFCFP